jgi:hypothetical protein
LKIRIYFFNLFPHRPAEVFVKFRAGYRERLRDRAFPVTKYDVAETKLIGTDYPYSADGRTLQVDVLVFDRNTGSLKAYEVKRGTGLHDSGKRRSMLRDVLCVQVLLKSYGKQRTLDVKEAVGSLIEPSTM